MAQKTQDPLGELGKQLSSVATQLSKMGADKSELRQATQKSGDVLAGAIRVKLMSNTRSGKLLSTVRTARTTNGVAVKIGNKRVPYAAPVNFGWLFVGPGHKKMDSSKRAKTGKPNIKPRRFMEKGIYAARERSINIWITELHTLVEKYERKHNAKN